MIEELIGAVAGALKDGDATSLILFGLTLVLMYVIRAMWRAKEQQAERHADLMNTATDTMSTLVEQLRTVGERQQELLKLVLTAGQNAAKNHETLAKIEGLLKGALNRQ